MPKTRETKNRATAEASQERPALKTGLYKLRPLSPRRRVITLAVGDAIVFLVFATIGQNSHGENASLVSVFLIALPFMLGWFLVSPFLGAFRGDMVSSPGRMAKRTVGAWVVSWPVAMALRWLFVDRANNTPFSNFATFAIIALCINMILLLLWREPFAFNNSIREKERERQQRETA